VRRDHSGCHGPLAKATGEQEQGKEMNMGRTVGLDEECCVGCGVCAELCPEVFEMNEEAIPPSWSNTFSRRTASSFF